jgi:demethylmenaquinone methyltransferase/2-methoxy-6-polyprenyl-1,4-benzoquinol methylase
MSRKAYFNEAANTWDEKYDTPELASFLEKLVPKFGLSSGQNILDVGTGTGILIPYLIQVIGSSGSITAIDYAEEMVKICKSKYFHLQNVTIKTQDIEKVTLPPHYFDAVTCFGLFPHLENKEKVLCKINHVLKTRGKLIIAHALSSAEIRAHHKNASLVVVRDILPEEKEMKRLLNHAGFFDVYIKDEPGCYLCISNKL